jgi:hypothetical protein
MKLTLNLTMDNVGVQILRSKDIIVIDGSRFFAVFDSKAGESMKPILCTLSFGIDRRFFQELALIDFVSFDMTDYRVRNVDSAVITLRPQEGYTNQKLEDFFCRIVRKYESMS